MKLTDHLNSLLPSDMNFARFTAAVAATLQIWSFGSEMYQIHKMFEAGSAPLIDPTFTWMHLGIAASLLTSAICLWFRNASAFFVSALGLMWVLIEYVRWYGWTQRVIEAAGLEHWPAATPHAFGIGGATGWDAAVLLLTAALFIWHIKTFTIAVVRTPISSKV